jgi:hypothetical protein
MPGNANVDGAVPTLSSTLRHWFRYWAIQQPAIQEQPQSDWWSRHTPDENMVADVSEVLARPGALKRIGWAQTGQTGGSVAEHQRRVRVPAAWTTWPNRVNSLTTSPTGYANLRPIGKIYYGRAGSMTQRANGMHEGTQRRMRQ